MLRAGCTIRLAIAATKLPHCVLTGLCQSRRLHRDDEFADVRGDGTLCTLHVLRVLRDFREVAGAGLRSHAPPE